MSLFVELHLSSTSQVKEVSKSYEPGTEILLASQGTFIRIARVDLHFPDYISREAQDLISRLLRYKPEERLSFDGVLAHPWILKYSPKSNEMVS
jgi:serine/threonine protein kinase